MTTPFEPVWARTNWQSYCVELAPGSDQRQVMQRMLEDGIATRRGVMNAHLEQPYRAEAGRARLPFSEQAQQRGLILPLMPSMTAAQVEDVCDSLTCALTTP